MQQRFTQALVGLRAAQRLLDANGAAFIGVNLSGTRAEFDAITARLGTLADAQETHRMGASGGLSSEQALARELRRKHMRPLVRVARSKVPAAAQLTAVSLPRIRSNSTDTASRARAMAAAVEPYKQLLHEAGLAADFSEQMVAAANELDGAVNVKKDHQFDRVGSTANIDSEVTEARLQLTTIDALVRAAVPENEDVLKKWSKIVRDIRAALRQASKPAVLPATTGTPVTPITSAPSAVAAGPTTPTTEAPAPASGGLKLAA